ncbi:MAG: ParB/RepB/Spo0J family partition protein [Candidatus Moraniibacteriota bacterium]|nr:MAG: ParB/RepB/Spo0J family partition protein [Candidatus Moranbacteria bacterium]
MTQQHGLGRGLSSLIPPKKKNNENASPLKNMGMPLYKKESGITFAPKTIAYQEDVFVDPLLTQEENTTEVEIGKILANTHQPRIGFDEEKLIELSDSIRRHGIIQPLIVTRKETGDYELIAGERRLRAAKMAGLLKVPVVVRTAELQEKFELAILENVQRHDLSQLEEARAYRRLMDEFQLSQEEVAFRMGKKRSTIANIVRLLDLPFEIQRGLEEGRITPGHAKVILSLENGEKQRALYEIIIKDSLTVRQTEERLRSVSSLSRFRSRRTYQNPEIRSSEEELSETLGTKVRIQEKGDGAKVAIEFYSKKELHNFLEKLRKKEI